MEEENNNGPVLNLQEENLADADVNLLSQKIEEYLQVYKNFNQFKEDNPGLSKVDIKIKLKNLFCKFYEYSNELMEYLFEIFSPFELFNFLEENEKTRPLTIRCNTVKNRRKELIQNLRARGIVLEPVGEWCKSGLKINESKVPIGATPEYLSGCYMLQSAASWIPVICLGPLPGDKVLDLAAAPGGKSTHIGQLLQNKGILVANDLKRERLKALHFNMQRLGISNCIITNFDGRKFPDSIGKFDRVLLDAPCTGLGIISRDPSIKMSRTLMDVYKAAHIQRELLRTAIDLCKVGGIVVYSTCSIAVEENEAVIDYAISKRYVKIMDADIGLESSGITNFKDKRFDKRMKYCIRVYPHRENFDGFFVCKLKKLREGVKIDTEEDKKLMEERKKEKDIKKAKNKEKLEKIKEKKEKIQQEKLNKIKKIQEEEKNMAKNIQENVNEKVIKNDEKTIKIKSKKIKKVKKVKKEKKEKI